VREREEKPPLPPMLNVLVLTPFSQISKPEADAVVPAEFRLVTETARAVAGTPEPSRRPGLPHDGPVAAGGRDATSVGTERQWPRARGGIGQRQEQDFAAELHVPPLDAAVGADDPSPVGGDERRPVEAVDGGDRPAGVRVPDGGLAAGEPDDPPAAGGELHLDYGLGRAGERAQLRAGRGVPHDD